MTLNFDQAGTVRRLLHLASWDKNRKMRTEEPRFMVQTASLYVNRWFFYRFLNEAKKCQKPSNDAANRPVSLNGTKTVWPSDMMQQNKYSPVHWASNGENRILLRERVNFRKNILCNWGEATNVLALYQDPAKLQITPHQVLGQRFHLNVSSIR